MPAKRQIAPAHRRTPSRSPSRLPAARRATAVRAEGRDTLARIERDIVACELCPRLRAYCSEIASSKRRAYRDWNYWGRPVPGFGDPRARLWVLGLAPAAHGGNRTGRVFTGDSSGDWLFRALHAAGFAMLPTSVSRDDGQELRGAWVSAAGRCAPPGNKPLPVELARCASYLVRELHQLTDLRCILALGKIAFDAALRLLEGEGWEIPRPRPQFGHGASVTLSRRVAPRRPIVLLASYHPSRQNTQTGKLTRPMLDDVFTTAQRIVEESI
jgi:uracil-DNA glycosylase family 4